MATECEGKRETANDKYKLLSGPETVPNDEIRKVNAQALYVAPFPVKVLLLGETGTGKSMLARFIHEKSERKVCETVCRKVWKSLAGSKLKIMLSRMWAERTHDDAKRKEYLKNEPDAHTLVNDFENALKALNEDQKGVPLIGSGFHEINLAALPEQTVSSELFGYVEGAFTDANEHGSPGLFIQANGGTLFLDEIADCPLPIQAKLLTVIQPRRDEDGYCPCYVIPNGQEEEVRVNVRLICATNKNLEEEIKKHKFREDLYYRLKEYVIELPALWKLELLNPSSRRTELLNLSVEDGFSDDDIEALRLSISKRQWREVQQDFYRRWFIQKVLKKVNTELGKANASYKGKTLRADAQKKLLEGTFKGNYRELQSRLTQACLNAHARIMLLCDEMGVDINDGENNPFGEQSLEIIENDIPDELDSTSGNSSGKEEESPMDATYPPSTPSIGHMSNNDQQEFEEVFSSFFTPEEKECISELLGQNVCSIQSLKAVINLPGFMRVDKCASMPKRDFSDIRSFIYLIGYMEQHNEITEEDAVKKVLGPKAKMGRFQRTLLPKFGIRFLDLQFAFKGI